MKAQINVQNIEEDLKRKTNVGILPFLKEMVYRILVKVRDTNTDDEESEDDDQDVPPPVENTSNKDDGETLIMDQNNISSSSGPNRLRKIMFAAIESGR